MSKKADPRYESVYQAIRNVAAFSLKQFAGRPDTAVVIAGAQAEALVRTLQGFALRSIKKGCQGHYLHHLFTAMLADVLEGQSHLKGRIVIAERGQKVKCKGH